MAMDDPTRLLDQPDLPEREREVLKLVAEGHTISLVVSRLDISVRTVELHRSRVFDKLDLHSVAKLTQFAHREGLVGGP